MGGSVWQIIILPGWFCFSAMSLMPTSVSPNLEPQPPSQQLRWAGSHLEGPGLRRSPACSPRLLLPFFFFISASPPDGLYCQLKKKKYSPKEIGVGAGLGPDQPPKAPCSFPGLGCGPASILCEGLPALGEASCWGQWLSVRDTNPRSWPWVHQAQT